MLTLINGEGKELTSEHLIHGPLWPLRRKEEPINTGNQITFINQTARQATFEDNCQSILTDSNS